MWVVRGVLHSCKRERSALWLNLMHCGKKWWIREFVPLYIFPLNPDDVAARSLRSLRSNEVSLYFSSQLYFKIYEPLNMTLISHLRPREENNSLKKFIRELKNLDDDRKWVTVYCASATSKFRRRCVVDDAKQSRIRSSCNPQASGGINPLF